jgi:hypothetical protein
LWMFATVAASQNWKTNIQIGPFQFGH